MIPEIQIQIMDGCIYSKDNFSKGSPDSVGYDLCYNGPEEVLVLQSGERKTIGLGFAVAFPVGYEARLCDRSGMASKHGIHVLAGVIDPDYRNEWKVVLLNTSQANWYTIKKGDRICQVVFQEVESVRKITVVSVLPPTLREGGFGSTGK